MNSEQIYSILIIYTTVTSLWAIVVWESSLFCYSNLGEKWCFTLFWWIFLVLWLLISVPKIIISFARNLIKK